MTAALLTACTSQSLQQRAAELCRNMPSDALCEQSQNYLSDELYDVLDTLFCLPDFEAMDHEWLHYFVAADGSAIADCACEVLSVSQSDDSHMPLWPTRCATRSLPAESATITRPSGFPASARRCLSSNSSATAIPCLSKAKEQPVPTSTCPSADAMTRLCSPTAHPTT